MNYSIKTLSEQAIKHLEDILADNPKFAQKLADAISERLDEKFGHRQGWMSNKLEELSEKIDHLNKRFDHTDKRFDTLDHTLEMLGDKQDLFERNVNRRFDSI